MKSKISYIKILKEQIKGQAFLAFFISIALFLAYPVQVLLDIENIKHRFERWGESYNLVEQLQHYYFRGTGDIQYGAIMLTCLAIIIGAISAVWAFQYLHQNNQTTLYHSLPIKRGTLIWIKTVAAFLCFMIPLGINLVLELLIFASQGCLFRDLVMELYWMKILNILGFFMGYVIAAIAMLLTGKVFVGILGTMVFMGYFPACAAMLTGFYGTFLKTYSYRMEEASAVLIRILGKMSPFSFVAEYEKGFTIELLWMLLTVVIGGILIAYLVKLRPSEATNQAMTYKKVAAIIRLFLVVALGSSIGAIFYGVSGESTITLYLGAILGVILSYAVVQMIYGVEFKRIYHSKIQLVIVTLLSLLLVGSFEKDLFGYDAYVPDYEDIAGINIEIIGEDYTQGAWGENAIYMPANEEVYGFLEKIVAENNMEKEKSTNVYVQYKLANGKEVYRVYDVADTLIEKEEGMLYAIPEYLDAKYPIRVQAMEDITITHIEATDWETRADGYYGGNATKNEEILSILQEELQAVNEPQQKNIVAYMNYDIGTESNGRYFCVPIYKEYEKTVEWLEKEGVL